jgi:hypothetical protein
MARRLVHVATSRPGTEVKIMAGLGIDGAMTWAVVAGICQLVLTAYFVAIRWSDLAAFFRRGRRTVNTFLFLIPMVVLAIATLAGAVWAVVVAAVFYSAWLLNHVLGRWIAPRSRRARTGPDRASVALGLLLVVVVVVNWYAAVVAYR